ncbi:phosphoribosylformylglycinamidine synthase subunit PurQ [Picrophilus oshimae]|nr:phosphoribosylformylglycinamidine synthase subunit PurQ [Picrophilus oshimae]
MDSKRAMVLRMEGTNNEEEAFLSLKRAGFEPEYVHINDLARKRKFIDDYNLMFIPGGFSAGDYIRAGAIFAARLRPFLSDINKFIDSGRFIIGVCNGFQVLTELGLFFNGDRKIALTVNESNRFECRFTYIRLSTKKVLSDLGNRPFQVPVAHLEGRVYCDNKTLDELIENDQIIFRYVDNNGNYSGYPWNPNGSIMNIAGITNDSGNVIGMMPHPERVYYPYQMSGNERNSDKGTGEIFFRILYNST